MKILWVSPNFLHPTTKGGQIRTLEMLRRLHRRHEIHYVAFAKPAEPEGPARAPEYCTQAYPVHHSIPSKGSLAFVGQLVANLFDPLPLAVARYRSAEMERLISGLLTQYRFDAVVCDFLFPAPNFADLSHSFLFQHNVETIIWQRHTQTAPDPIRKVFFGSQARRMLAYEGQACRNAGFVIAVSDIDAQRMRELFGVTHVAAVPTGVDVACFTPPAARESSQTDLVFLGSMDWMPNIDGVSWFAREILPRIRAQRPQTTFTIVGRTPPPAILALAERNPGIRVTGTVEDVRPYLWSSTVCVVPLRIGGGTRLKIFEAMAARIPVVSTSIGAEGLPVTHGLDIALADSPEGFATRCLELLASDEQRVRMAVAAWKLVDSRISWESAATAFEALLVASPV